MCPFEEETTMTPDNNPAELTINIAADGLSALALAMLEATGMASELTENPDGQTVAELADRCATDTRMTLELLRLIQLDGLATEDGGQWMPTPTLITQIQDAGPFFSSALRLFAAMASAYPDILRAFTSRTGVPASSYSKSLTGAMDMMTVATNLSPLTDDWIPKALAECSNSSNPFDDPKIKFAEVGCGGGEILLRLATSTPWQLQACDASSLAVKRSRARLERENAHNSSTIFLGSAETLRGPCDLILMNNVLHDTVAPQETLHEVKSQLKPNGGILIVEACDDGDALMNKVLYATSLMYCIPTTENSGADDPLGTLGVTPNILNVLAAASGLQIVAQWGAPGYNAYVLKLDKL